MEKKKKTVNQKLKTKNRMKITELESDKKKKNSDTTKPHNKKKKKCGAGA